LDEVDAFEHACYFDRDGQPLTLRQFGQLSEVLEYRRVAETYLHDNEIWVSTVWLGLNHNFGPTGPPLIFESMVFVDVTSEKLAKRRRRWPSWREDQFPYDGGETQRYATEAQAIAGHEEMVESLRMRIEELDQLPG
jgi:hypothetical protein